MIDNDLVKAALIAKANSTPGIQAFLASGTVLEYNFKGTDWTYPCGRLYIENQTETSPDENGCPSFVDFSWYIFSEKQSSKQADQIAGSFVSAFRASSFTRNNIKFSHIKILENIPAISQDERTWRAQIRCRSLIHNQS